MEDVQEVKEAGPEIFIGLVGAVGTDLALVTDVIAAALDEVAYRTEVVRLSALLKEIDWDLDLPDKPLDEHISKHMDAGDALRETWGRGDALALVALGAIADRRESLSGNGEVPVERCAYVLRSLKHPKEVERLRSVYGKRFLLLAAYSSQDTRTRALAEGIAADKHSMQSTAYLDDAYKLVQRDEVEEGRPLGQNVRDTFHRADFFVDARSRRSLEAEIARVIEILFGHPFRTPSRDEQAMFLAEAAAMRSAEMGRQVGAVVATTDGDVVSVGTNEVPKPGGGLYWEDDPDDARDFIEGQDTSDVMKRRVVGELLQRLVQQDWISAPRIGASPDDLYDAIRGTRLASLIEFGRAVHAEMAALIAAWVWTSEVAPVWTLELAPPPSDLTLTVASSCSSSGWGRKGWVPGWKRSSRSGAIAIARGCRSGRWPSATGCIAGR